MKYAAFLLLFAAVGLAGTALTQDTETLQLRYPELGRPPALREYHYELQGTTLVAKVRWDVKRYRLVEWSFSWNRSSSWETTSGCPFRRSNLYYAERTAEFVREHLWDASTKRLIGETHPCGWAYNDTSHATWDAMQIMGHVWLYDKTGKQKYLDWARDYAGILFAEWDSIYGGWFESYDRAKKKGSWDLSFPIYSLSLLFQRTNDSTYLDLALQAGDLLVTSFLDTLYGGYYEYCDSAFTDCAKKNSEFLGSIGQAFMVLYETTGDSTYIDYAREANDFVAEHFYTVPGVGIPLRTSDDGNTLMWPGTCPNNNHWGTLGMTDYYRLTGDTTYKAIALELINHVHKCFWDSTCGGNMKYVSAPGCSITTTDKEAHMNIEHAWMYYKAYLAYGIDRFREWAEEAADWVAANLYDEECGGFISGVEYNCIDPTSRHKMNLDLAGAIIGFSYADFYRDPEWSVIERDLEPTDQGKVIRFYISVYDELGNEYRTPVEAISYGAPIGTSSAENGGGARGVKLSPAYPNPFNPRTLIAFSIPERMDVSLAIYDVSGRLVRMLFEGTMDPGIKNLLWDGTNRFGEPVASGIYFYRLDAEGVVRTRKLLLLK